MTMVLKASADLIDTGVTSTGQVMQTAPSRILTVIGAFFEALQEGKSALRQYDEERARGDEPDAALRKAFDIPQSK